MEIIANETGELEFSKVYNPIKIIADPKEPHMTICIRDGGYEVAYGDHYVLLFKKGQMHFMTGIDE